MGIGYEHGITSEQVETSISTPRTAGSGIVFVVGTAPVQQVGGKVNDPVLALLYKEAVSALGYSDNWRNYTLCEVMYSHFQLYGVSPVVFVNVLDPKKHKKTVEAEEYEVIDRQARLPFEAIAESVEVTSDDGSTTYAVDEDFGLLYDGDSLILEVLEGGAIPDTANKLKIAFTAVDPSKVSDSDIIGGFNVATKKSTGFELVDAAFAKFGIVPDLILCPGWSHRPEIAAIMTAKAENINGVFEGKALIDIDTTVVRNYTDAPEWKKRMNIFSKYQILFYPMVKLGEKLFHLSVQAAGLMAKVDTDNGDCPCESASNKNLQANSAVIDVEGSDEIFLDPQQANYLNSQGIVTTLNFMGGFVLWGNESACFPANTDVKDYFYCISRMFGWVANTAVLTFWKKLDKRLNRRLIDNICDTMNIWLNGLTNEEKILGGRVEFREDENPDTSLMAGKATFHIFITPCSPAKHLHFILEYDVDYLSALFA